MISTRYQTSSNPVYGLIWLKNPKSSLKLSIYYSAVRLMIIQGQLLEISRCYDEFSEMRIWSTYNSSQVWYLSSKVRLKLRQFYPQFWVRAQANTQATAQATAQAKLTALPSRIPLVLPLIQVIYRSHFKRSTLVLNFQAKVLIEADSNPAPVPTSTFEAYAYASPNSYARS